MDLLRCLLATKGWYTSPDICMSHSKTVFWSLRGSFPLWGDTVRWLCHKSVHQPDSKCKSWKPGTLDMSGQKPKVHPVNWRAERVPYLMLKFPLMSWRIPRLSPSIEGEFHGCFHLLTHLFPYKILASGSSVTQLRTHISQGWPYLTFAPLSVMASECVFSPLFISLGLGEVCWVDSCETHHRVED